MRRIRILLPALGLLVACQAQTPAQPEPVRVESPALKLAFANMPSGFEVLRNDDEGIEIARGGDPAQGRMWVEVGPLEEGGNNLVEIVKAQKEAFLDLPGGQFSGNNELVTPHGPAFYSRGSFQEGEGARTEETRIFTLHPSENRLVTLHYQYPQGEDSKERVEELLFFLGEMEPLSAAATPVDSEQATEE